MHLRNQKRNEEITPWLCLRPLEITQRCSVREESLVQEFSGWSVVEWPRSFTAPKHHSPVWTQPGVSERAGVDVGEMDVGEMDVG